MDVLRPPYAVQEVRFLYHCSADGTFENQDGMLLDPEELRRALRSEWFGNLAADTKVNVPLHAWVSPRDLVNVPAVPMPPNLVELFEATIQPVSIDVGTHGKRTYQLRGDSNLWTFITFADAHNVPVGALRFGPPNVLTVDWSLAAS